MCHKIFDNLFHIFLGPSIYEGLVLLDDVLYSALVESQTDIDI